MSLDLQHAARLARRVGHVLVATSGADGQPHVAAARKFAVTGPGQVALDEWFCPGAVANLRQNPHLAVVIWDAATDEGIQLLGQLENVKETAVTDGYLPRLDGLAPMPQVEHQLVMTVDKALYFSQAPHSDVEE